MCIVSTVSSLRVVGNVSVCGVNKVDLGEKKKRRNIPLVVCLKACFQTLFLISI